MRRGEVRELERAERGAGERDEEDGEQRALRRGEQRRAGASSH